MIPLPLPGAVSLAGGISLHTFRLLVVLGLLLAGWLFGRTARALGLPGEAVADAAWPVVGAAYLGARLGNVLVTARLPGGGLGDWLGLEEAAMALVGALLGALAGLRAYARRRSALRGREATLLDAAAPAASLGLAAGVWGSGRVGVPSALPWSSPVAGSPGVLAHPLPLYGSVAALLTTVLTLALARRRPGSGEALATFALVTGLWRYLVGFFAAVPRPLGPWSSSQPADLLLALAGLVLWIGILRRSRAAAGGALACADSSSCSP